MRALSNFDRPPVIEAVAGVEFGAAWDFAPASLAIANALADRYRPVAFQPAIPPTPIGQGDVVFQGVFGATAGVMPTRLQLMSSDQVWVVQLQADRATLNWRRVGEVGQYPGFESIRERLDEVLSAVTQAIPDGLLRPSTIEYTYVNGITNTRGSVFRLIDDRAFEDSEFADGDLRFQVVVPREHGRVTMTAEPHVEGQTRGSILSVVCNRFVTEPIDRATLIQFVDDAHTDARHAFTWITTDSARLAWGEKQEHDDR